MYKDMNEHQLALVLDMLNQWWSGDSIPEEVSRAQVLLIFKTNTKSVFGKQFTHLAFEQQLQDIYIHDTETIAGVLDKRFQPTHYGFGYKKSTAQAAHCVRRVLEK